MTDTTKPVEPVAVKPLDLSNLIRLAVLHGRGYPVTKETRKSAQQINDDDQKCLMDFDPEGIGCFDRVVTALDAANAEIERLTKAHDTVCGTLAEALKRLEKAEAESATLVAAAYADSERIAHEKHDAAMKWASHKLKDFDGQTDSLLIAKEIAAKTPADANAAIEARDAAKVREGMQQALDLIAGLPTGRTEEVMEGQEQAYRVIESAIKEKQP